MDGALRKAGYYLSIHQWDNGIWLVITREQKGNKFLSLEWIDPLKLYCHTSSHAPG